MVITALLPAENKYKIRVSKYCEIQKTMRGGDQRRRCSRLHRSPGSGISGRTITVPLAGASSLHAWLDAEPVPGTVHSLPIRSRIAAKKVRRVPDTILNCSSSGDTILSSSGDTMCSGDTILNFSELGMVSTELARRPRPSRGRSTSGSASRAGPTQRRTGSCSPARAGGRG